MLTGAHASPVVAYLPASAAGSVSGDVDVPELPLQGGDGLPGLRGRAP